MRIELEVCGETVQDIMESLGDCLVFLETGTKHYLLRDNDGKILERFEIKETSDAT